MKNLISDLEMYDRSFKLLVLMLALCTGCVEQAYKGNEKSPEALAIITSSQTSTDGLQSARATIVAVDGDYFDVSPIRRVEVLPGKHTVVIRCWRGSLVVAQNAGLQGRQGSVEFIAQAGREYQVFCSTSDNKFVKWITDLTTDEIVGGKNERHLSDGDSSATD